MSRATILSLFLVSLLFQSGTCDWKPKNTRKEEQCKSSKCEARGNEYLKNLNPRVHPCQDFYSYVCGNWEKNYPGPKWAPEWGVIDLMHHDMMGVIRRVLESNMIHERETKFYQAKMVYDTCMKIPEFPMKDSANIAKAILSIGRFPTTKLWDLHDTYLKVTGESAFFDYKILGHKPSEGIPVLMLMEPVSAYGSILHDPSWTIIESKAYTEFLFMIMKSLKLPDSDAKIRDNIAKVFEFRKKMDRVMQLNRVKRPDKFTSASQKEFQGWFDDNVARMTKSQDVHWTVVVDTLLQYLPWQMRQHRSVASLRQKTYFLELLELMRNVPEEVLANHIEIFFVERHLILDSKMIQLLERTSAETTPLLRTIRENFSPKWQICIEHHNMVEALEEMIFQKWFPRGHQAHIHTLIANIKAAMEQQMKASSWLSYSTYMDTKRRLQEIEEWVGFPTWFTRRAIPTERDKRDILTPNASLNIRKKLLNIHATLLLPPLFSPEVPALYNYASLGTTIGHELYHIMNDCGSYPDGDRINVWWPEDMRIKCISRKFCFVDEYNKITDRDFKTRYNLKVKSDTSTSFSENFPDMMGLEAAYMAYQKLVTTDKTACQVLPQFRDFSCDQMFFISFANTFCGRYTKKKAEDKLEFSVHSIDSVRVNGAVSQMEAFRDAFACSAGAPMNPAKRCNLWK